MGYNQGSGQGNYYGNPPQSEYGGGPRGNYGNQQKQVKKHSGFDCKKTEDGEGWLCWGWNYSKKRGMIKMYARPYKNTKRSESKTGKIWWNLFVTITFMDSGQVMKTSGLFEEQGKRLYLKELNLIGTKKGRGGYLGRHLGAR